MTRAVSLLRAAWWWTVALAAILWLAPAIILALARLAIGRMRFALVILVASALRDVGAIGSAAAIYRHEQRRAGRRMAKIRARRGVVRFNGDLAPTGPGQG